MKLKIIGLIFFSVVTIIGLFYILRSEKQKSNRLYQNLTAIVEKNKYYNDSLMISNKVLIYEVSEIKKLYPDLKQQLKDIDIKIKDVKQYQKTLLDINAKFEAKISQKNDTTLLSKYTDKYLQYLSTINLKDSTEMVQMKMPVKLEEVVWSKRKPGFWNWIKNNRELMQKVWTDNPYIELEYNEIIQVSK